jgi:hypothetical protein
MYEKYKLWARRILNEELDAKLENLEEHYKLSKTDSQQCYCPILIKIMNNFKGLRCLLSKQDP